MRTMLRTDNEIHEDILAEFLWDPEVSQPDVGVQVDQGVVTLTGSVDSYAKKIAAQHAAQRVDGVRAVANDLSVRSAATYNDTDIAKAVARALELNLAIPEGAVDASVQNGQVTLTGSVKWGYQRNLAASSVRYLRGVRGVTNLITVTQPAASAPEVSEKIQEALRRSAEIDAATIAVHTTDGKVRLTGTVRSWPEKDEAGMAAWRAPGVKDVENDIVVRPY